MDGNDFLCQQQIENEKSNTEAGAVSLEAAISLPIFICVVVAFSFLLCCVQVQERIQHAITQAAVEIAGTSYLYGLSGVQSLQQEAETVAKAKADQATDAVKRAAEFEQWAPQDISETVDEQLELMTSEAISVVNSIVFSQFAKLTVSKYLSANTEAGKTNTEQFLQSMNVIDGIGGLDFSGSTFLADGSDQIVIRVRYSLKAPIFIPTLSIFHIEQEAYARAWLYREPKAEKREEAEEKFNIWSLPNFKRGEKIQEIFHANLPFQFPGLSSFESGTATLIRSLDTTAKSYQEPKKLKSQVDSYIRQLNQYEGQEVPWGDEKIVIRKEDINIKRLVLVIPENDISAEANAVLNDCIRTARSEGVLLVVERYANKNVEEEQNPAGKESNEPA